MLDGTGDAHGEIHGGTDRLASLAHLPVVRHDAGIDHRTRRRHFTAQDRCQFLQHVETFLAAHAAAAGDQDLGLGDVHGRLLGFDGLDELDDELAFIEFRAEVHDLAFAAEIGRSLRHHAGTDGRHLRTVLGAFDGSHQVAAEGRTGHFELVRLFVDRQLGAVCRQAGAQTGGDARSQVTADGRGAVHQDRRLEFVDGLENGLRILLGHIVLQQDIVDDDHLVGTVGNQRLRLVGDLVTGQDGDDFLTGHLGQFLRLADQFEGDRLNLTVPLLSEYIDIFICRKIHSDTVLDG